MTDALKAVVAEWVLTNGQLPGYEERLKKTLDDWPLVGEEGMTVYRGQGATIVPKSGNIAISVLKEGVRSVIATTKKVETAVRFTSSTENCCVFVIKLAPGIRYLDVNETIIKKNEKGMEVLDISNDLLKSIVEKCPTELVKPNDWPTRDVPLDFVRDVIIGRCKGRKFDALTETGILEKVTIHPEDEILLDGNQGVFQNQKKIESEKTSGIQTFTVDYTPKEQGGKRKRTRRRKRRVIVFRRTSKRLNKNE